MLEVERACHSLSMQWTSEWEWAVQKLGGGWIVTKQRRKLKVILNKEPSIIIIMMLFYKNKTGLWFCYVIRNANNGMLIYRKWTVFIVLRCVDYLLRVLNFYQTNNGTLHLWPIFKFHLDSYQFSNLCKVNLWALWCIWIYISIF